MPAEFANAPSADPQQAAERVGELLSESRQAAAGVGKPTE
jgi:hypothetical protein